MSEVLDVSEARSAACSTCVGMKRSASDCVAVLQDENAALKRKIEDLERQIKDAMAKALQDNQQVLFRAGRMSLQPGWQEGVEIHSQEILDILRESGSYNDQRHDTHWAVFEQTGKFPEEALKDKTGVGPPREATPPREVVSVD